MICILYQQLKILAIFKMREMENFHTCHTKLIVLSTNLYRSKNTLLILDRIGLRTGQDQAFEIVPVPNL